LWLEPAFFQHFFENSTAKKPQFLPFWQKLKAIFVQKLKVGSFYSVKKLKKWAKNSDFPSKRNIAFG